MKQIGQKDGYTIYWSDPQSDGGTGTGEVMVGLDAAGRADSKSEALRVAERWITQFKSR